MMLTNPRKMTDWFVCSQPKPAAETRLFFFPYAGGGPAVFYKWLAEFPGFLEGWTAHYPGRGSRSHEPSVNNMIPLVEALSQAILPLLDRPFAFFGHSLGGLAAFELTRHLRRNNLPQPTRLFISACGAPHHPDSHPPIHELPDTEFIEALRRLNGIPAELLQQPDVMELLLPILRADYEIIEKYRYIPSELPLACRIIALGGLEDPRTKSDQLESWAVHTSSGFRSEYFPGDHFFINTARESIIASIASEIKASLPS